jgi:hypothetical protein
MESKECSLILYGRSSHMGEVIEFRKKGECCATCHYWVPRPKDWICMLDGPPSQYCTHPDRLQGYSICDEIIRKLDLYRRPDSWCTRYEREPGRKNVQAEWQSMLLKVPKDKTGEWNRHSVILNERLRCPNTNLSWQKRIASYDFPRQIGIRCSDFRLLSFPLLLSLIDLRSGICLS